MIFTSQWEVIFSVTFLQDRLLSYSMQSSGENFLCQRIQAAEMEIQFILNMFSSNSNKYHQAQS